MIWFSTPRSLLLLSKQAALSVIRWALVSSGFIILFAVKSTLYIFQQRPGLSYILRIHPHDQVCRESRQSRAAQLAGETVGAQQPAGQFGFIATFRVEACQFDATVGIYMGQLQIFIQIQVLATRGANHSAGFVIAAACSAQSFGLAWFSHPRTLPTKMPGMVSGLWLYKGSN